MSTLTTKSEATYGAIVEAGLEMALVDGIGKVSLGEIAKRLGISKSGVFSRVGSLEALQEAVLDEYDRHFAADVFLPSLQQPKGLPRLMALVDLWLRRSCARGPRTGCLYTAGAFEYDGQENSQMRERLQQGAECQRASLRQAVLQAMELDHLRPDTNAEQLVFEIYCFIVGFLHDARFMRDPNSVRHVQAVFCRLVSTYKSFTYQG